jgi:hypothetical protein
MSAGRPSATAGLIRQMAEQHHVAYVRTENDRLADHFARLADSHVELDDVERMLIALQRAGHINRTDLVRLQAIYLREMQS